MSEPLVCVHCLTYNHGDFIEDALKGFVMQQTSFPFIVVVVDDCSTDNTVSIIKKYEAKYPSIIKPFYLEENYFSQKKSKAPLFMQYDRKAKYIAMCEGDDYWIDPYKLQKQVCFLENNQEYGLCYTDYNEYNHEAKTIKEALFKNGKYRPSSFEDILFDCSYIAPMSWVYKKSVFEALDYKVFTDGTLSYALAFYKQSKVFFLPEVTCVYRSHSGSMSNPSSDLGYFRQYKGVFETQLYFADKYHIDNRLLSLIKSSNYVRLLPLAIKANQEQFINEAVSYFDSICVDTSELLKLCNMYLRSQTDCRNARNSRAYRLGRALLFPFNLCRRFIKSILT